MKRYRVVRGLELVKLPATVPVEDALRLYRQNPDVLYAEPNYVAVADVVPNDPSFGSLWGLQKINAPEAWR